MRKFFSIVLKMLLIIIILVCLIPIYFIAFEYKPEAKTDVFSALVSDTLETGIPYSALIWNIGYAGLGMNMDFFYDGGVGVRDTKENVLRNFQAISKFLVSNDSVNFVLLQEVDVASKRSYHMDQLHLLESSLTRHMGFLGLNYKTDYVPVPASSPLGKVKSGIAIYSDISPIEVARYGFSGNYSWPKRIFMLKRCFLACVVPINNYKDLHIVNIHNSAYDDGSLREEQLEFISEYALEQYNKGNYVLFGGDWNQSPDNFKPRYNLPFDTVNLSYLPEGFLRGWQRIYSDSVPSNRRVNVPYSKGKTMTTVIDYYIVSPNILVPELKPQDLNFENSDHHPLIINFILNDS